MGIIKFLLFLWSVSRWLLVREQSMMAIVKMDCLVKFEQSFTGQEVKEAGEGEEVAR